MLAIISLLRIFLYTFSMKKRKTSAQRDSGDIDFDFLFDHYDASVLGNNIFGLSFSREESSIVLLPVPWEATVSYGSGTAKGPAAILAASTQLDIFDCELGLFYKSGITMLPESSQVRRWNAQARRHARKVIAKGRADASNRKDADAVNALGAKLNAFVEKETRKILKEGKIPGLIGGDHSISLGAIKACADQYGGIGVLHFDAHVDGRESFEDFEFSHASTMHHVLEDVPQMKKLVQVGVRDYCKGEDALMKRQGKRMEVFFDEDIAGRMFQGETWKKICEDVVGKLPQNVYVSFDIDALDPSLCPHTGTPVPGGLSFQQALLLLKTVAKSGRKIVGFDLVEVAPGPDEWDANVGARVLFKLCGWALESQK